MSEPKRRGRPPKAKEPTGEIKLNLQVPDAFIELYQPHRYKVFWGGRGGAKSWAFADALIIKCWRSPTRVLCARELQKSIRDSVHKTLKSRIFALGLEAEFHITDQEIRGKNGSEFIFSGIRHNTQEVKSMEGIDVCWVEEAEAVTSESWSVLIPTIRKANSEIWVSFNPRLRTDSTYQRFVLNPPKDAYVRKVSWRDNPWFPDVLKQEMEDLKERDYEEYLHIWEGEFKQYADGAYYKKELQNVRRDGRICNVMYEEHLPVYTVWDLGVGDSTAIIFAQLYKKEIRIIDYYEMSGEGLQHYAKVLKEKPYVYAAHYAPHDIRVRELTADGKSRIEMALKLGIRFEIVPNVPVDDGINAVRATLGRCWFDEKKTERLIAALQNYHREWDDDRGDWRVKPAHDWSSHGSDAMRYLAVGLKEKIQPKKGDYMPVFEGGWMR